MTTNRLQNGLLRYMLKRHVDKFGKQKSNLRNSHLYLTSGQGMEKEIPGILIQKNGMNKYLVVETALELQHRGLVKFNDNNTEFWLTDLGYEEAAIKLPQRILNFLNKNGGISILISLASLVIAILSSH